MKTALWYALFAVIATAANIGSQDLTLRVYTGLYAVAASIFVGTAVGLLVKYILDKKFIFRYRVRGLAHDGGTFLLYTLMGFITTLVFWGFEFGFDYLFHTKALRYTGGVIGLALGYVMKYHLDKRFVFRTKTIRI